MLNIFFFNLQYFFQVKSNCQSEKMYNKNTVFPAFLDFLDTLKYIYYTFFRLIIELIALILEVLHLKRYRVFYWRI